MLWTIVWTALALGALAAGFLAWRHVWRRGKGLLRQLAASADDLGDVIDAAQDRIDARLEALVPAHITVGEDPAPLRRAIEQRRARARLRHRRARPEVWERWAQVWR
ncbi:hypothetical protein ACTVCO_08990 [Sanguibacter sp. A247]|uniref:hypothetical protein n=1 Tax=unclassified Sanguibacter TaxID=2645534 RepID=UPI003FD7DAC0